MMDNKRQEECSVCFNDYDDVLRPRSLPCGHAFCSECIDNAIKNDQLTCTSCLTQHSATTATQFPINYGMEALIRKSKGTQVVPVETVVANPCEAPVRGIGKKLRSVVEEQKSSIISLITSCEEILSQLGEYRGQLGDWKTHHLQLQDRLSDLVEQNKEAMNLLEQEEASVVDMTSEGVKGNAQLQSMLENLGTVNTSQEADITMDSAEECSVEVVVWIQNCQELFPNINTVYTSLKVQETIRTTLDMTTTDTDESALPVLLGDSTSSIMNKTQEITLGISQKHLSVEDLRKMSEPVKRLVEAGRVFAVQEGQDGRRSARITLQDGQLFLHTLLPHPMRMPAHAFTLQESDVVSMLNPSCTLAFLDFGWAGSTQGRVTIRLTPDTQLARQFVLLCTGQQGPTYHNTNMLYVTEVSSGWKAEGVVGGDYEYNDGEGGAPLLPYMRGAYRQSGRAGSVLAPHGSRDSRCAQYLIATSGHIERKQWSDVFGDVVNGLDVVTAAAEHSNINEVTVVDCGVVLPL